MKYHEGYLCQISRTNHAIICLTTTRKGFVIFTCSYFKLKAEYHCSLSQSNCRNFSCSSINIESFFKKSNKLDGKERNCFHSSVGFQISNSPIYLIYTVDTKNISTNRSILRVTQLYLMSILKKWFLPKADSFSIVGKRVSGLKRKHLRNPTDEAAKFKFSSFFKVLMFLFPVYVPWRSLDTSSLFDFNVILLN